MEAVLSMSSLTDAQSFGVVQLPSPDLLSMHVSDDFMQHVVDGGVMTGEATSAGRAVIHVPGVVDDVLDITQYRDRGSTADAT